MVIRKSAHNALYLITKSGVAKKLGATIRSIPHWAEQGALEGFKPSCGCHQIIREPFNQSASNKRTDVSKTVDESRLKVVVVEDDQAMLTLYQHTIESWKMPIDVTFIENGWKGIISISQNTPDLLMTDLKMPAIDGFSMLKVLRDAEGFERMAMAVVTGMQLHEIEGRGGLPKDVRLYGKSPVPFFEIRELMQELLDRKHERLAI